MTPDEIRQQVEVNLTSTMILVQMAVNRMIALGKKEESGGIQYRHHRAIGVMGSVRGRIPIKPDPYEFAKAGLHNMVAGLAPVLGPYGISINGIAPGTIDCPVEYQRYGGNADAYRTGWGTVTPLARADGSLARPEDVAETMVHLLNSARTTGEVVCMDGGYNRHLTLPLTQHTS